MLLSAHRHVGGGAWLVEAIREYRDSRSQNLAPIRFLAVRSPTNMDDTSHPVFCIEDTLSLILQNVGLRDIPSVARVCQRWNALYQDDRFWAALCAKEGFALEPGESAREVYRSVHSAWSAAPGHCQTVRFAGHENGVRGIDMRLNDSFFVTASDDKTVRVWYGDGDCTAWFCVRAEAATDAASRQGSSAPADLASVRSRCFVRRDFNRAGQCLRSMHTPNTMGMNAVHLTSDGRHAYGGCDAGVLSFYDLDSGQTEEVATLPQRIRALAIDNALNVVWTANDDRKLYAIDRRTRKPVGTMSTHIGSVCSVAQKENWVASGGFGNQLIVNDVRRLDAVLWQPKHIQISNHAWGLDFSQDGTVLAGAMGDGNTYVFSTEFDAEQRPLLTWQTGVSPRCVSLCNSRLVVSADRGSIVWVDNWRRACPEVTTPSDWADVEPDPPRPRGKLVSRDWCWVVKAFPRYCLVGSLERVAFRVNFGRGLPPE